MAFIKWVAGLWCLCIFAIILVLLVGRQQQPLDAIAMLHLDSCELPCWIGIVPDKTTVTEALEFIAQTYGHDSRYTLEYLRPPDTGITLTDKRNGNRLIITLNFFGNDSAQNVAVVNNITFYFRETSDSLMPSVGTLSVLLGSPTDVILYKQNDTPESILVYSRGRGYAFTSYEDCNKIDINGPIGTFMIFGHTPTDIVWIYNMMTWRGFNVCHYLTDSKGT